MSPKNIQKSDKFEVFGPRGRRCAQSKVKFIDEKTFPQKYKKNFKNVKSGKNKKRL